MPFWLQTYDTLGSEYKANWSLRQTWCNEAWLHFVTVINFTNTSAAWRGRRWASTFLGLFSLEMSQYWQYHRLKTKRMLMLFNDVPLKTRRALSPYTSYSNSALLVLNGASRQTWCNEAWLHFVTVINFANTATGAVRRGELRWPITLLGP